MMLLVKKENVIYDSEAAGNGGNFMIVTVTALEGVETDSRFVDMDGNDIKGQTFTVKGPRMILYSTMNYRIKGEWVKDRYGISFALEYAEEEVETSRKGIINFLTSGIFKGVGPSLANSIYNKFGENTLDVISNSPELLELVPRIGEKLSEEIATSYKEHVAAKDTILYLSDYNISSNLSLKVYDILGKDAVQKIEKNPYILYKVRGFDFATVDKIGLSKGFTLDSKERVSVMIEETLRQVEGRGRNREISNPGSLCVELGELIRATLAFSRHTISQQDVQKHIKDLVKDEELSLVKQGNRIYVYRKVTADAEDVFAKYVAAQLRERKLDFDIDEQIRSSEVRSRITLDKTQKDAIKNALTSNISVITGGPGTGKTTIIKIIADIFEKTMPEKKLYLTASTGAASRRMTESTNRAATTVHNAFRFMPDDSDESLVRYDDESALECDLLIIDEFSMIDQFVASAMADVLSTNTQVVFIGDINQLPSVGAGSVLRDLIESDAVPVAELRLVHRQGNDSLIAKNAQLMKNGNNNLQYGKDFVFIETQSAEEANNLILKHFNRYVKIFDVNDVTVLSPFRERGVNVLNPMLQDVYNPLKEGDRQVTAKNFRVGDKVMQLVTDYDMGVFNGDVGVVIDVDGDKRNGYTLSVDYGDGKVIDYEGSDIYEMLDLAYATTIHKSQGSEYKIVIIQLLNEHSNMLKNNLIYTAITRAKQRVVIIGNKSALDKAILTQETKEERRKTMLAEKIKVFKKDQ